ncbi:unnamed protein product [Absidia cylindrospora]
MVKLYKLQFPDISYLETGLIPYLFENPNRISDGKELFTHVHTKQALTYGQVKDGILQFAAGLQDYFGFGTGDVLALFAPNAIDFAFPALGAIAAGGVLSPSNPRYSVEELRHQLELSDAKVLVAHPENIDVALQAAALVGIPRRNILVFGQETIQGILPYTSVLMKERRAVVTALTPEEARSRPCYLCFSSGTTGKSKGVMTSHTNAISAAAMIMYMEDYNDPNVNSRRGINCLPMFHQYALLLVLHISLRRGTSMALMAQFDLVDYLKTIQDQRITNIWTVPPIILALAKDPRVLHFDLSSLKFAICAAAPLSKELSTAFAARFPNIKISQSYGLTETSPSGTTELVNDTAHGSCGVLMPNMIARIVKEDGSDAKVNERGEIWLKGPNIMLGYIKNKEATANTVDVDGFLHTGDVGVIDEKDRFYIVDRIKELIKYKGFQVAPAELEGILLKSPLVNDCAVIGVYDSVQATEVPRGYVVLKPGIDASNKTVSQIQQFVADQVASFKQIRQIRIVDSVPKTASGKILRRVLRDQVKHEQQQQQIQAKL